MKKNLLPRLLVLACLILLILSGSIFIPAVRWIDRHVLDERIRDVVGRLYYHENWSEPYHFTGALDYTWMTAGNNILIAHALGAATRPDENTLSAMQASFDRGIRIFEVDLWLDAEGYVRCHHGPATPPAYRQGACLWQQVLSKAVAFDGWVVLDIKTDFRATAETILASLPDRAAAKHVIFQLYHPGDLPLFAHWATEYPLAGPIVTAYLARRSLQHIARSIALTEIRALTIPLERRKFLGNLPTGLNLFVHPVHDCAAFRAAQPAKGVYVTNDLAVSIDGECMD
jgi:hypothetical protein